MSYKNLIIIFCLLFIPCLAYDSIDSRLSDIDKSISEITNKMIAIEQKHAEIYNGLVKVDVFSLANKVWIFLMCILFLVINYITTKIWMWGATNDVINYLNNMEKKKVEYRQYIKEIIEEYKKQTEKEVSERQVQELSLKQGSPIQKVEDKEISPVQNKEVNIPEMGLEPTSSPQKDQAEGSSTMIGTSTPRVEEPKKESLLEKILPKKKKKVKNG